MGVAAVFAALNEAAESNDASLAAAANDGLRLVQGRIDINEIVNILGNAIYTNFYALKTTTPLWNRLANSNNATVAMAGDAIRYRSTFFCQSGVCSAMDEDS